MVTNSAKDLKSWLLPVGERDFSCSVRNLVSKCAHNPVGLPDTSKIFTQSKFKIADVFRRGTISTMKQVKLIF